MERPFYNEDFDLEELIKQKSDQYKMYPSEKVWKGVHGNLHSSRKWYWFSLVFFLAGLSYYTLDQLSSTSKPMAVAVNDEKNTDPSVSEPVTKAVIVPINKAKAKTAVIERKVVAGTARGLVVDMYNEQLADAAEQFVASNPESGSIVHNDEQDIPVTTIKEKPVLNIKALPSGNLSAMAQSAQHNVLPVTTTIPLLETEPIQVMAAAEPVAAEKSFEELPILNSSEQEEAKRINWLQENAVYEFSRPKPKRLSWQATLTPTMNYRRLVGNKKALAATDSRSIPIALNLQGEVDNFVNHKPAVGFELGSMFLYQVNKNLTFKTGVAFNYSRYDIQAYGSATNDVATIALNGFYGTANEALTSFTRIRNFGGNSVKDLRNEYYQVSAPVGVELLVFGKRRLQFSVGGTIQPTYLLNHNSYLITTDFKNYTREPSLVRRFNMNTSAEAFISYKVGGYKLQLGPQFRYQLFSSYDDKYPIREFLMEYGVKLGISRSIR